VKKNVASQKVFVFAWDTANGVPKTGDAANISAQISKDGGAAAGTNDAAPTELDAVNMKGIYYFNMLQEETNCDVLVLSPVSSTADIDLEPVVIHTTDVANEVWDEVLTGASHNVATSAGKRLRNLGSFAIRDETAQAGTVNTITLDVGASATDEIYDRNEITITAGVGAGQTRTIIHYNGTSKVAIVDRDWINIPNATSEFQILASANMHDHSNHGQAQAGAASSITLNAEASATNNFYNDQIVYISSGTGQGQARLITAYNGTTKVATISPSWSTNPDNTSIYHTIARARSDMELIEGADATATLDLARIRALLFENAVWEYTYDGNQKQTGGVIYLYDTAANANTHDGSTGLIGKYTATITLNGNGDPTEMTIVKNS
jgi:hypothetical protein